MTSNMTSNNTTDMETQTVEIIKCPICKIDFEATTNNFYTCKGKLTKTRCKKCKVKQCIEVNKKNNNGYAKHKEYYKAYMRNYNKLITMCPCGSTISRGSKSDHLKTPLHARRLKLKQHLANELGEVVSLPSS